MLFGHCGALVFVIDAQVCLCYLLSMEGYVADENHLIDVVIKSCRGGHL